MLARRVNPPPRHGARGTARLKRSSVQAQLPTERAPSSARSLPCKSHGPLVHTSGHVLGRSGRCARAQSGLHRRSGEPTEAPLRRKAETDRVREGISEGFRSVEPGRVAPGGEGAVEPWHTCSLYVKTKSPLTLRSAGFYYPGSDLLSHHLTMAVSSALEGLTSVFGMGTGVAPPVWPPGTSLANSK